MIPSKVIEELILLDNLSREQVGKYPLKRFLYPHLKQVVTDTRQMAGIAGLRGTGKTILLRQLALDLDHTFYLSADTLPPGIDLFEVSSLLVSSFGIKYLMIDEIHAIKGWQEQLKKIFDFQELRIIFTSSSSLELSEGKYDLSRRLTLQHLPLFSFREYLAFNRKTDLPVLTLDEIVSDHKNLYPQFYSFEPEYHTYIETGALPACLESPLSSIIVSTVEKVIQKDILTIGKLSQEDIHAIKTVLLFLARAGVEGCSYSSISRNTGITKFKAQQYIGMMESASLLKIILPYGANVTQEPKILLAPTLRSNLAHGIHKDQLTGAMREEFFIHHITGAGITLNYLKNRRGEKLPDYVLFHQNRKLIIEIGGAGKNTSQFKGIEGKEKLVLTQPGSKTGIPLILFGFLW
ncbi:MAG: ATP-binding protein [Bacteroidetes bacterium]|nr:ATP-binding protein [Bacteroidota bacterium]